MSIPRNSALNVVATCLIATALSACDSQELAPYNHTADVTIHNHFDIAALMLRTPAAAHDSDGNLLINGSFENQQSYGWNSCANQSKLNFSNQSTDGASAITLKKQQCVYQGVSIDPRATVSLVCDARVDSKRNDWTGLGISFYDQYWNYLQDAPSALIDNKEYTAYEVTGQAPESAVYASVWFYTENKALLDNCFLTSEQTITENLLYNGDFTIHRSGTIQRPDDITSYPVTQPDGWRDACRGVNLAVTSVESGEMVVSEGACVHQQLSNEALDALRGNYFEMTCTYNLTTENFASIAANLTDLRATTGMNDRTVLTKTSTSQEFLYGTATLSGKASDNLGSWPSVFVAIGKQGNDMLFVRDCSLRVVDGPAIK